MAKKIGKLSMNAEYSTCVINEATENVHTLNVRFTFTYYLLVAIHIRLSEKSFFLLSN